VTSQYGTETTWLGPALGAALWIVLGWFCLLPLAVAWGQCKDVVHRCPKCRNVVAQRSKIGLPSLRSEVMTFKFGSCAVLLARKYFVVFVLLICAILGVHAFRISSRFRASNLHLASDDDGFGAAPLATSWAEYLQECKLESTLRAVGTKVFHKQCQGQIFRWQGELAEIHDSLSSSTTLPVGKSSLLVRMPSGTARRPQPTVALLFGEDKNVEVKDLAPGAWVEFEGKLLEPGRHDGPDLMLLRHVAIAEAARPSPPTKAPPLPGSGEAGDQKGPTAIGEDAEQEEPKVGQRLAVGAGLLGELAGSDIRLQVQLSVVVCLALLLAWIGCMYVRDTCCQD